MTSKEMIERDLRNFDKKFAKGIAQLLTVERKRPMDRADLVPLKFF